MAMQGIQNEERARFYLNDYTSKDLQDLAGNAFASISAWRFLAALLQTRP